MDIKELLKNSPLYPILIIESIFSSRFRRLFINISGVFLLALFALATFFSATSFELSRFAPRVWGLVCLGLAFYFVAKMIEWYFNSSYYFDNIALNRYHPGDLFTFTVGRVLLATKNNDVLYGFMTSAVGTRVLQRCGITSLDIAKFLELRPSGQFYKIPISPDQVLKFRELVIFLFQNDSTFAQFLADHGINESELVGAVNWVIYEIEFGEYRKRWWSSSNLSRLPGIAKDWGFGNTGTLDKYGWDLLHGLNFSSDFYGLSSHLDEINQVENVLAKQKEANVFIVAETGGERMDIIWSLVRRIKDGIAPPALEYKRPVLFNSAVFLSHFKEKLELEAELLKIFKEVSRAGNILLIFDNFNSLLQGFRTLGSNFLDLFYPFLNSNSIQTICLVGNDEFHQEIENNGSLMALFDRVFVRPLPVESVIHNLEQTVWSIEEQYKLFFTYPALLAIVEGASKYFSVSDSDDKASDLLTEIIPWAKQKNYKIIDEDKVQELLQSKTGIPIGKIREGEKEKLLGLEKNLAERVVGQREALTQVSNALRRARSGIRSEKKPIGSFLFLGPTGVGKTETAKALAEIMFGAEENLLRLDMSQFQTSESADNLIGSAALGRPGLLINLVRENSYGVLLLDEFEKAHSDVHDLFLTILDEGYFSDKSGRQVSLRDMIIIATSNAGADFIWRMVREGKKPELESDALINNLVTRAILKPELLNRFDAVVIYHPLLDDELKLISRLMLGRLAKRLSGQGITLMITDYLVSVVAKLGANEVFGARPMQRFIQDHIEQQVADGLIKGDIKSGFVISFEPKVGADEPELIVKGNK
ncbi:MAG TPA: AAA family ATPase [Candidatus Paceibacterota bacterium]|nr:AAA family ATPase [Candidatus Paceibacterota bacterium]